MVLNLSCPAVSQICSLTTLPSTVMDLRCMNIVLEPEINSNGGEITFLEGVIGEPSEKRGFTDWTVADQDNLEEVIVLADHYEREMWFNLLYNLYTIFIAGYNW